MLKFDLSMRRKENMELQKLPVGIPEFEKLRQLNCVYVDKTELVYKIASDEGAPYFLSRPRRFGKSILTTTFKSLFEHGLEYFKGLAIEKLWTDKTYKVLYLNFADMNSKNTEQFIKDFNSDLLAAAERFDIDISDTQKDAPNSIIRQILKLTKEPIVILIDEYDSQLATNINNKELFEKFREILHDFFNAIKNNTKNLRFFFITGVSRFSNASLFSAFNNLQDISMNIEYAGITGFSVEEFEYYFKEHLEHASKVLNKPLVELKQDLKEFYDGYCFDEMASVKLYNPWSVLNFLKNPRSGIISYWASTAQTSLVYEYYARRYFDGNLDEQLDRANFNIPIRVSRQALNNSMNISEISESALLFQTGYLSVVSGDVDTFTLLPPNLEIKAELSEIFVDKILKCNSRQFLTRSLGRQILKYLLNTDTESLKTDLNLILKNLSNYNTIFDHENSVRDLISLSLKIMGIDNYVEVQDSCGRMDLMIPTRTHRFVFEFKLATNQSEVDKKFCEAKKQIIKRDYGNLLPALELKRYVLVASKETKSIDRLELVL